MRKEYEQAGLPDYINPNAQEEHDNAKAFEKKLHEREKEVGRELNLGVSVSGREKAKKKTIGGVKNQRFERMPLRIAYEKKKIDLGKLPIWYLQAIGSMTVAEKNEFIKNNQKDLTINEIIATDLLDDVLEKDKDALKMFWDLQKTLMGKKTVINEIHQTVKPNSVMNDILADIEKNAMDAETISEKPKKSHHKKKIVEGEVVADKKKK